LTDILIINGPNLNLLGTREPEIYGKESLSDVEQSLKELSKENNIEISFVQSNAEHEIINYIQRREIRKN
jgi:3-dehydroquinate dehydratase-2